MWLFLADEAMPFVVAAVRVFGARVLAADEDGATLDSQAAVGRQLLRLVFGTHDDGQQLPGVLADLVAGPDSRQALAGLRDHVDAALEADPEVSAAAVKMLKTYHRRRADVGEIQALVDLGDLLYWGEPEGARAAYQEAIDAGNRHAMIDLAKVLQVGLRDEDAALAVYRQVIDSADPDLAVEAMVELAQMYLAQGNRPAARAMYQQAIDTGHAEWAAAAMLGLAGEMRRDDPDAALALYRRAIETGNALPTHPSSQTCSTIEETSAGPRPSGSGSSIPGTPSGLDRRSPSWSTCCDSTMTSTGCAPCTRRAHKPPTPTRSTRLTCSASSSTATATPRARMPPGSRPSTRGTSSPTICASGYHPPPSPRTKTMRQGWPPCRPGSTCATWHALALKCSSMVCPPCPRP